jgi:transcription elongation factor GreA
VTETHDDSVTWLTRETYDRLKAELDHLSGSGRANIAKKIEAARDEGDLSENSGYHAAKDEQGQMEARIITLQHILANARVGSPPLTEGVVGPSMTVTIRFVKDDDEVTFLLASREEVGAPIDVYSFQVAARRRHHGQEGGREGHLLVAERPHDHGRDRGRRPVHQSMSAPVSRVP